jgi:fructose-1-phosphate kinase PfkB-like protein
VITRGGAGAAAFAGGELLTVTTPPVETVNATGSGDCFAAALAYGLERGLSVRAALPLAAGAGAANAATLGTAEIDAGLVRRLAAEAAVLVRPA